MIYLLHLSIFLSIYIILALSLNLVIGYMGRINLAHSGFVAIGAYTYALLTVAWKWNFCSSLLIALFLAVLLSLFLSLPSWKFQGDFFIMITLVVQALFYGIIYNWSSPGASLGEWNNITNGPFGIAGISKPDIFGIKLDTIESISVLSICVAMLCAFIVFRLTNSPWGRLLKCIRDDELAIRGLGKNVRRVKIEVFAIACGLAAIGGVIYASYVSYIDPTTASLDESILLLCMICVGGMGNFRGPIIGAIILILLPELLRLTPMPQSVAANFRLMAYGLLLIIMVHFRPQGIAGEYRLE